MLKNIALLTFLSLANFSLGQIENLWMMVHEAESDSALMHAYIELDNHYYQIQPDSCQFYAEKAYDLALKINDRVLIPVLENDIGLCELHKDNYENALHWFQEAIDGFIEVRNERSVLMAMNNIGAAYNELQQPVKALPYLINAQDYAQKMKHYDVLMLAEMNLGNAYGDLKQLELSEEFFRLSRSRIGPDSDPYNYALNTYNIANIILAQDIGSPAARNLLFEAYDLSTNYGFYNIGFMATNNLVSFYLREGNIDLDSAKIWLDNSDSMVYYHNYPTVRAYNAISHGIYYRKKGALQLSLDYLLGGFAVLDSAQDQDGKYKLKLELSKTYELLGEFKTALYLLQESTELKEQLYNEKNTMIFADLKNSHEIEKKDQEIALTRKDNAIKDQMIRSEQNRIKFFIIGTVLLGGLLLFIVYFLIQKNRNNKLLKTQNSLIEEQRSAIEEKQNEILDSINYAFRIQAAIIPKAEKLRSLLKEGFVLYLPKDVVSGDFYWTEQVSQDEVFVAVADCTGHGVPGAMVSIVCNNALNRAVREFALRDTGEILDKTRELVIAEFEENDESVKDGMDISLARINYNDKSIQWSGANNPLLVVRKNESPVLEEVKADKQPIGQFHHQSPFNSHKISLKNGDRFFLFSDGFADQFGGEKGKKMKNKKFKEIIVANADKPLDEMKDVLKSEFESWRGQYEQLDDVCIIGVEFKSS